MDKQLARQLLLVVNDNYTVDAFKQYASDRIDYLRKQLDSLTDPVAIYRIQGQITELKRFESLREEVINASK